MTGYVVKVKGVPQSTRVRQSGATDVSKSREKILGIFDSICKHLVRLDGYGFKVLLMALTKAVGLHEAADKTEGREEKVQDLFRQMLDSGCQPNMVTYVT